MGVSGQRALERVPEPIRRRLGGLSPGRAALAAVLLVVLIVAILTGGGDESEPERGAAPEPGADTSGLSREAADLLEGMPVERKVAQLFLVGFEGTDADASIFSRLRDTDLGGVVLTSRNYEDRRQLERLTREIEDAAGRADHVPPWIMAAQEGGDFSAFGDLPPSQSAAEIGSPADAGKAAAATAKELRSVGVKGILGPVLDVGPEERGALGTRVYSDSAADVTEYAAETVGAFEKAGIFSAAKHFPGLGGASQPTELGPANVGLSFEELAERDLRPFEAAIAEGVPGIVVGNGVYASDDFVTPASLSMSVTSDLLREQLGFEGLALADDLSAPAVTAILPTADAAVEAIRAGTDQVYVSGRESDQEDAYDAVLDAVGSGDIPTARIDEALVRVLRAKSDYGLIE